MIGKGGFTLVKEQFPQTSNLPPKYDMKHCFTNFKHRHIGAKNECCVAFKICQNAFYSRAPLGELTTLPRPPNQLGRGHPSPHTTALGVCTAVICWVH